MAIEEFQKMGEYIKNVGEFLETAQTNTGVDSLSKTITHSFFKVFKKLDGMTTRFVNLVGPSFTKKGEE